VAQRRTNCHQAADAGGAGRKEEMTFIKFLVRHLYFQLGRKEREIASELGITCSTVNYYKNRQKR